MLRDALGNEIKEKDFLSISAESLKGIIVGQIMKIEDSRIVGAGVKAGMELPARVHIQCILTVMGPHDGVIGSVVKVHHPEEKK